MSGSITETRPPLTELEQCLLNDFQRNFPLSHAPYAELAERLGTTEQTVLETLRRLQEQGAISRIGPVFRPHRVGASVLAAIAVPEDRLAEVAELVNGYAEVNHNYEREHRFNLWFVLTAPDAVRIQEVLDEIEYLTALPVMALPMLEDFHIDLGFDLRW